MNIIATAEFILISVLNLVNVQSIIKVIFKHRKKCSPSIYIISSFFVYLAISASFILTELYNSNSKIRVVLFLAYYSSYTLCLLVSDKKTPRHNIIYTAFMYLIVDSVIQSGFYIWMIPRTKV